jgi:hypothetical protein
VVVYLRAIHEPLRERLAPGHAPGEVFPLLRLERVRAEAPETARLLPLELAREAATMVMLASVALALAPFRRQWLAAFAVAFGVWDLSFYLFLKLWTGWPASLLTWDVLFLIPAPWSAPVLAPVLVSVAMVGCGLAALRRPVRFRVIHWTGLALGCLLIWLSFLLDYRHILAGGLPQRFAWPLFLAGGLAGVGAFLHAAWIRQPGG